MRYFALLLAASVGYCQQFTSGQAARLVIGQRTFTDENPGNLDPNDDTKLVTSEYIVGGISGIALANNRLFVADSNRAGATPINNRVLIFNDISSRVPAPTARFEQNDPRCPACISPANIVLGQPDFVSSAIGRNEKGMRLPTAVASDGIKLAVADTDNNRVLIWNNIPNGNTQAADVVIGQVDFTTFKPATTDQRSLRGPQGVWFQNGKLFVADTQNHRVLIYNSVPTSNNAPADIVLGQPDFNTAKEPTADQILAGTFNAQQNTLLNPVSATSDGTRLFVADLGHNRVMIWNNIPTANQQQADVVLGQPDFTSAAANNSSKVCPSNGTDTNNNPTYPLRCNKTLNFPRFVLSDGTKLFVADGGNDRILIWSAIPTQIAKEADLVLGQVSMEANNTTEGTGKVGATDTLRTPMSLAYDGTNLFASDCYNRRVLVFTPGAAVVPYTGVRNAGSMITRALGAVVIGGTVKLDDEVTITIGIGDAKKDYKYKIVQADVDAFNNNSTSSVRYDNVVKALTDLINADDADPNVIASPNYPLSQIVLVAKAADEEGNKVEYSTTLSDSAVLTATAAGSTLTNGQAASLIAPGTLVTILGDGLSDFTESAPAGATQLPTSLANTEVYFDGLRAPLLYVSPTQINAQLPWEVQDATSVSALVRSERSGGVQVSSAVAVPVIPANPGIFAQPGQDPRPGIILHGSSFATGTISVDGSLKEGDVATVIIAGSRRYSYTVPAIPEGSTDTVATVRDRLIEAINNGNDPDVTASAAGVFNRIRLKAKRPGPDQNGIAIGQEVKDKDGGDGASVILSPFNTGLCCANIEGALVTQANPAVPGETIIVYATGLGFVVPDDAKFALNTGQAYNGPVENRVDDSRFVDALAGGKTANVIEARAKVGAIGMYEVILELNSELPTNPVTQLRIAQQTAPATSLAPIPNYVPISNIVTFPLQNPTDNQP